MKTSDSIASEDLSGKFGFVEISDPTAEAIGGGGSFAFGRAADRYRRKLSSILANPTTRSRFLNAKVSLDGTGQASATAIGDHASVKVSVVGGGDNPSEISTNLPDDLIERIVVSSDLLS
jgi:hypothetical protein